MEFFRQEKKTGVGCYFLLQGIFPTQEFNWGLLHCRWILYQLSYQGSVCVCVCVCVYVFSCVHLFAISWTIAPKAPLSRGFASPRGFKRIRHDLATKQQLYIYILYIFISIFLFIFFSIMVYPIILNIAPCAIP